MTNQTNQNFINASPYLRTSRSFPEDLHHISIEMNKAYIDIANAVNARTIGLFSVSKSSITGESWFYNNNQKHQSIRQLYTFTTVANNMTIAHGLNFSTINSFARNYGEYTDGTNWYGLISGSSVAIAGQISFFVTPTNIVFKVGAGAPTSTNGLVVLEWLSNV